MVKDLIPASSCELLSQFCNDAFMDKIPSVSIGGDYGFTLGLRMLLIDKIGDDSLGVIYAPVNIESMDFENCAESVLRFFGIYESEVSSTSIWKENSISLYSWRKISEMEDFKPFIDGMNSLNMSYVEDLSLYLSQFTPTMVFMNDDAHQTVVVTGRIPKIMSRHLSSVIPRLMPWYFTNGIEDDVKQFVELLMKRDDPTELYAMADSISADHDIRGEWIESKINSIERTIVDSQINRLKSELNNIEVRISDLMSQINRNLEQKKQNDDQIWMLMAKKESGKTDITSEFATFCRKAKNLTIDRIEGTYITFFATAYLDEYDPEVYERIRSNSSSYIGRCSTGVKKLLDALYGSKPILKLWTCAQFDMNVVGGVGANSGVSFPDNIKRNALPNPHLYYHACLGDHVQQLTKAMSSLDYIYAAQIALNATRNINFADSIVGSEFVIDMEGCYKTKKCYELPDGTLVTGEEAVRWIDKEGE